MAFLWVFIYSSFIHTGEDHAFYEAYAQVASPWVAILLAGPVFFVIARWMRGRWPDAALSMVLPVCALSFLVAAGLSFSVEGPSLAFQLGTVTLATATMATGGVLGARRR